MTDNGMVPLTLVRGDEELLVSRAVADVVAAARRVAPETDVQELDGAGLSREDLGALLAPSLFGDRRILIVNGAAELEPAVAVSLIGYPGDPVPGVGVVVVHPGGAKGRKVADQLAAAANVTITCARLTKTGERLDFLRGELRASGRQASPAALRALLDAVGTDLRELANAVSQLAADTSGDIDEAAVTRYHRGKTVPTAFPIADKAVEGEGAAALELLRWALSVGMAPVLVSSALAANLRSIAKVASAGRGNPARLAKQLDMPPWKVERTQRQARGWHPDAVAAALRVVAWADAEVKGAGADPGYALERAVLAVVEARRASGGRIA